MVEFTAPAPSVPQVTPSEQLSPFLHEKAEVLQVLLHERLLQRTDVLSIEHNTPAPSVTHVTPSEPLFPFPHETADVMQVMPRERLLQRIHVLAIEHNTLAPSVIHVTPSEQFSPLPQETVEVMQIGFCAPAVHLRWYRQRDRRCQCLKCRLTKWRQERLSRVNEYDNETLSSQRSLRMCRAVTILLLDSPFHLFLSKLSESPASRSAFENAL